MHLPQPVFSPAVTWAALIAAGVVCSSCGGGGSSPANPYAGSYSGMAVDANNDINVFDVTVDSRGNLTGTYAPNLQGGFTGSIDSDGAGSFTLDPRTGTGGGTLAFGPLNNGTSAVSLNCAALPGALVAMVPTTPLSEWGSQFLGAYIGTITDTTLGVIGGAALSVSPTGAVTGFEVMKINGTVVATPITGTAVYSSSAAEHSRSTLGGSVIPKTAENGVAVEGTITVTNGQMDEAVSLSNGDSATLALTNIVDITYPGAVAK